MGDPIDIAIGREQHPATVPNMALGFREPYRRGRNTRKGMTGFQSIPLEVRFATYTQRVGECVEWTGSRNPQGYGTIVVAGKSRGAHQVAYEMSMGPVPIGLELDHLCRNRACVNPAHLEPVTHRENTLRGDSIAAKNASKTHCSRGHPYSGDNLRIRAKKRRGCRICHAAAARKYRARKRGELA